MAENVVDRYGWTNALPPRSCEYLVPEIARLVAEFGGARVLDLGAGNGHLCASLRAAGHHVVGVEYDGDGVEVARASYPHISFYKFGVQDDPNELLAKEAPFDIVVSTEVVEHLFSPHLLPKYAAGVLRPNGFLILTTPYHGYLKNLMLSVFGAWDKHHSPLWHGGHIKFWSRRTLSQLVIDGGFAVVRFSGVGRMPYLWKSMVLVAMKVT